MTYIFLAQNTRGGNGKFSNHGCFSIQAIDAGEKKITVNAVAPGAIKTDMYQAVAREYIPGGESFTDEQVDEVCSARIFDFFVTSFDSTFIILIVIALHLFTYSCLFNSSSRDLN